MAAPDERLARIAGIARQFSITSLRPQIAACRDLLDQAQWIDIAVLGRFKAGKSSFLNDLIGGEILPTGVVPVTTVVTRLSYGPVEKAEVRFLDGRILQVKVEEIASFVTESDNPDNRKQVSSVDMGLPSLKTYEGLRFVDTPGLGSIFKHNTEMARKWLPRVGAALIAMSVDAPLSEEDRSLLRDVQQHAPRVALLLTKADLKTEEELGEIQKFVEESLGRELRKGLPVFFASTKAEHPKKAVWKESLARDLLIPIRENREAEWQSVVAHKLGYLRAEREDYLRIAVSAAGAVAADCDRFKAQIFTEENRLASMQDEIRAIAKECASKTRPVIQEVLKDFQRPLEEKLARELKFNFRPLIHRHFLKRIPGEVEKNLSRLVSQWSDAINGAIETTARNVESMIGEEIKTVEHLLSQTQAQMTALRQGIEELGNLL